MTKKDLSYYMGLPFKIEIIPDEDGAGFNAAIPDLRGCMASGETEAEALEVLTEVKQAWFELALERGWHIPEPAAIEYPEYSGRFNVRLPRFLHRELAEMATREDTSLNQLVVALLSEGLERQKQRRWTEQAEAAAQVTVQLQRLIMTQDFSPIGGFGKGGTAFAYALPGTEVPVLTAFAKQAVERRECNEPN